ncbi:MAG: alcohol dehydrogenase catalytic domain-containing protein [Coriobacteriia bacterium]|nr:alcohol dehydrogenase catalytic domain-containing protein [Coriobacteriia bacterium]MCL2870854.1 alcohol dehydrogenase catalytic domain-containing protein [Coriobacteriia bacterium]
MRAIVHDGARTYFTTDHPEPKLEAGEALVKVTLAALCNTDREVMAGYSPGFNNVMGHEFVGIVAAVADSTDQAAASLVGKRVVGEINLSCFSTDCPYCSTGRSTQCPERTVAGIHGRDGCFADYLALPTRLLHVIPDSLPDDVAIYAEPLAAALRITELSHISPDQPIALVGDGRLAYMIAQVIALTGAPLTVFGLSEDKLALFEPFAVDTQLVKQAAQTNDIHGYEVVIDATGHPSGLTTALSLVRSGGLLVMKSTYASSVEINMSEVVVRELTIRGNRCGPFAPALRYLDRGMIHLPSAEVFNPADFQEAFKSEAFKTVLDFS